METCSAEIVIYIPTGGAPDGLAEMLREALARDEACEQAIALACLKGGVLTVRHDQAPYGSPYGIDIDRLAAGLDADLHVAAHFDWEATIVWLRAGIRVERASASAEPEPLMTKDDLERLVKEGDGDHLEDRLRSSFDRPPPSYDIGPQRVVIDWDGTLVEE